jgi:MFS family permease
MVSTLIAGRVIARTGRYRIFPVLGSLCVLVGLVLLTGLAADTPVWRLTLCLGLVGFGLGGCLQPLILAAQNAVPAADIGSATALVTFFRGIGGTVGVAVLVSLLFNTMTGRITAALRAAGQPDDPAGPARLLHDSAFLHTLPAETAGPYLTGISAALAPVFWVAAGALLLAFVATLRIREDQVVS